MEPDLEILVRRRLVLGGLAGGGMVMWTRLGAALARPMDPAVKPLILLDPGHGGHDPGAIGAGGTLEKSIALDSGLQVRQALEAHGRYRVALTRSRDRFLTLDHRVVLAQEQGADLFLSLHADIDHVSSLRGVSVYTLADHASDRETAALAARENAASAGPAGGDGGLPPDIARILSSLANRETRAESVRLAHLLIRDMAPGLRVLHDPERRANFTVLHAAGIPSVLIEMGFLSNREDEAALNRPAHRALIARAITRTVDRWFTRHLDVRRA
jgi:N-acetylmuramoyl-L-alanine amidase